MFRTFGRDETSVVVAVIIPGETVTSASRLLFCTRRAVPDADLEEHAGFHAFPVGSPKLILAVFRMRRLPPLVSTVQPPAATVCSPE